MMEFKTSPPSTPSTSQPQSPQSTPSTPGSMNIERQYQFSSYYAPNFLSIGSLRPNRGHGRFHFLPTPGAYSQMQPDTPSSD